MSDLFAKRADSAKAGTAASFDIEACIDGTTLTLPLSGVSFETLKEGGVSVSFYGKRGTGTPSVNVYVRTVPATKAGIATVRTAILEDGIDLASWDSSTYDGTQGNAGTIMRKWSAKFDKGGNARVAMPESKTVAKLKTVRFA